MAGKLSLRVQIGSNQPVVYDEQVMSGPNPTFGGARNTPTRASRTQNRISREISAMLTNEAVRGDQRNFENDLKVMVSSLTKVGETESRRLIDFIGRHLINRGDGPDGTDYFETDLMRGAKTSRNWTAAGPAQGQVSWEPLSRRWMHQKGNTRYFSNTGQLKREVLAMRHSYPEHLGGVKVKVRDMSKRAFQVQSQRHAMADLGRRRIILANLEIQIFPNADARRFPGLATGRWDTVDRRATLETSSIFSKMASDKLRNMKTRGKANKPHFNPTRFRPMFGPATQFWIMHRIPAVLGGAIERGVRLRRRFRQ